MEVAKRLGEEIKNIRTDILNITQKDMAEKLNISIVYMSYLEKGKKLPSKDFLNKMYKLIGKKNIPDDIIQLLSDAKKQKKKENYVNTPTNVVYRLEEEGLYSYTKLKSILKKNSDNLAIIYGILTLLVKEGRIEEAKKHLLQSLINIEKPEERKWIEATYYELEGNFPFAIQLMHDSISEFDKRNKSDNKDNMTKARLLFETACIHFRYGQYLYYNDKRAECINNFKEALKYHYVLKDLSEDPFYMMDYAGIFFWLALLDVEPEKNWRLYIEQVKTALVQNYKTGMKTFDVKRWKSLYSKQYIISTVSFLVRAYAELARYKTTEDEKNILFNEGDFLLSINTPVDISIHNNEYYRYYFNKACFYSLKAELSNNPKDKEYNLDLVNNILLECLRADLKNKVKVMVYELDTSTGIKYFRENKPKEHKLLIQKLNNP